MEIFVYRVGVVKVIRVGDLILKEDLKEDLEGNRYIWKFPQGSFTA